MCLIYVKVEVVKRDFVISFCYCWGVEGIGQITFWSSTHCVCALVQGQGGGGGWGWVREGCADICASVFIVRQDVFVFFSVCAFLFSLCFIYSLYNGQISLNL